MPEAAGQRDVGFFGRRRRPADWHRRRRLIVVRRRVPLRLANLCEVPPQTIEQLHMADYERFWPRPRQRGCGPQADRRVRGVAAVGNRSAPSGRPRGPRLLDAARRDAGAAAARNSWRGLATPPSCCAKGTADNAGRRAHRHRREADGKAEDQHRRDAYGKAREPLAADAAAGGVPLGRPQCPRLPGQQRTQHARHGAPLEVAVGVRTGGYGVGVVVGGMVGASYSKTMATVDESQKAAAARPVRASPARLSQMATLPRHKS